MLSVEERVDKLFATKIKKTQTNFKKYKIVSSIIVLVVFFMLGLSLCIPAVQKYFTSGDIDTVPPISQSLGDEPFNNTEHLGYELLDNNSILHIWNSFNSYYFNVSDGIQFSNHYLEYWTRNVLMLGYYDGDSWNLIYRTDELSDFNKNITGETDDYINATLWKDLNYGGYDFRLAIRYHLGVNDNVLTIIPYMKAFDDIPYDIGFGWEMKNIKINMLEEDNYISLDGNRTYLHDTVDDSYSNFIDSYPDLNNGNLILLNVPSNPWEGKSLEMGWNKSALSYLLRIKSRANQYNAPTTLFIKVGSFVSGQEKYTELTWIDSGEITFYDDEDSLYNVVKVKISYLGSNRFVLAFMDVDDGSAGKVIVGKITGNDITNWGTVSEFCGDVYNHFDICVIDTDKIAVAYADDVLADDGYTRVATINDLNITSWGAAVEFETGDTESISMCKLATDKYVISYNDETASSTATGCACSVVGTAVTPGTPNDIAVTDYYMGASSTDQLDTDKFVTVFDGKDAAKQYAAVGTTSGTTITWGLPVEINAVTSPYYSYGVMMAIAMDVDKFVAVVGDYAESKVFVIPATVSGTTITVGTKLDDPNSGTGYSGYRGAKINATTCVYAHRDSGTGECYSAKINWATKTVVANHVAQFYGLGSRNVGVVAINDTGGFALSYERESGDHGYVRIGSVSITAEEENTAPTFSGYHPSPNGTTGITLQPQINVIVTDAEDSPDCNWYTSPDGSSWTWRQKNSSVVSGTNISYEYTQASAYNTVYYWKVTADDGTVNVTSEHYHFTTEEEAKEWYTLDTWNMTLSNTTQIFTIDTWNITLSNTTIYTILDTWNITLSNTSTLFTIDTWNITLSNISTLFIVDTWNITLSNTSTLFIIDTWNITLSNTTQPFTIDTWNITLSNTTTVFNIDVWNITLSNTSIYRTLDTWNITLSNTTQPFTIDTWNITLSNTTIYTILDTWNITLSNTTQPFILDTWNITLSNTSILYTLDTWNITLSNTSEVSVFVFYSMIPITASIDICPCRDAICFGTNDTLNHNMNVSVYRNDSLNETFYLINRYSNISNGVYCFCIDGHMGDFYYPIKYNETYYWYVNATTVNTNEYNVSDTLHFTTVVDLDDCLPDPPPSVPLDTGLSMGIMGGILGGIIGSFILFKKKRRKPPTR